MMQHFLVIAAGQGQGRGQKPSTAGQGHVLGKQRAEPGQGSPTGSLADRLHPAFLLTLTSLAALIETSV